MRAAACPQCRQERLLAICASDVQPLLPSAHTPHSFSSTWDCAHSEAAWHTLWL
jgi:hypothetical protein